MKRSGGFAVVEMIIAALVIAIFALGGYYVAKRNHHASNGPSASVSSNVNAVSSPSPTPPAAASGTLKIPEFGIQLVSIPDSIKDLTYMYYPANTASNFTEVDFTTGALSAAAPNCTIGSLERYPGKYNVNKFQGQGNFVKQFNGFWILEVDEGVPCMVNQTALDMQNNQIKTFKQYVTNPDILQVLAK